MKNKISLATGFYQNAVLRAAAMVSELKLAEYNLNSEIESQKNGLLNRDSACPVIHKLELEQIIQNLSLLLPEIKKNMESLNSHFPHQLISPYLSNKMTDFSKITQEVIIQSIDLSKNNLKLLIKEFNISHKNFLEGNNSENLSKTLHITGNENTNTAEGKSSNLSANRQPGKTPNEILSKNVNAVSKEVNKILDKNSNLSKKHLPDTSTSTQSRHKVNSVAITKVMNDKNVRECSMVTKDSKNKPATTSVKTSEVHISSGSNCVIDSMTFDSSKIIQNTNSKKPAAKSDSVDNVILKPVTKQLSSIFHGSQKTVIESVITPAAKSVPNPKIVKSVHTNINKADINKNSNLPSNKKSASLTVAILNANKKKRYVKNNITNNPSLRKFSNSFTPRSFQDFSNQNEYYYQNGINNFHNEYSYATNISSYYKQEPNHFMPSSQYSYEPSWNQYHDWPYPEDLFNGLPEMYNEMDQNSLMLFNGRPYRGSSKSSRGQYKQRPFNGKVQKNFNVSSNSARIFQREKNTNIPRKPNKTLCKAASKVVENKSSKCAKNIPKETIISENNIKKEPDTFISQSEKRKTENEIMIDPKEIKQERMDYEDEVASCNEHESVAAVFPLTNIKIEEVSFE